MLNKTTSLYFIAIALFTFSFSIVSAQSQKNVLIIGIDGLRGDAFMSAYTPNIEKFMNMGEYSFDADMGSKTNCVAGWASLSTGVWHKKHGAKDEEFKKTYFEEYPHFFSLLENKPIRTASIITYEPITSHIDCCSQIMLNSKNDNSAKEKAIELIRMDKSDLIILNYHELDACGQEKGFGSEFPTYVNYIQKADSMFVDVLTAVQAHAKKQQEEWLVVITSDHEEKALNLMAYINYNKLDMHHK
ncbi:MAG: hypothetical protein R2753_05495 [Chitinophagales bacterium]